MATSNLLHRAGHRLGRGLEPIFEWVPSQKGLFVEAPHRQSTVLAWIGKAFPLVSRSAIVLVIR